MLYRAIMLSVVLWSAAVMAQLTPQERGERTISEMKRLADAHYPAITRGRGLPDDMVIGFLVDRELKPLRHSVGFKGAEGEPVGNSVAGMFPDQRVPIERGSAACFGTGKLKDPRYCVMWIEMDK